MNAGKLPAELLARLLAGNKIEDPRVLVGPAPGVDAAAIAMGERILVAKSDPVTFATEEIGWYAVNVNANDVASMGATPRWFLATVLLPEGSPEALAEEIFAQIRAACAALGISLVGGHTEITYGLPRPLVSGCLLGEAEPGGLHSARDARVGDLLILTQGIAVEGTALLAREARQALRDAGVAEDVLERAAAFLSQPGISVVNAARLACACPGVHALHDPTEGGLITGVRELAAAASAGVILDEDAIPVLPETRAVCAALRLDPLGLIASGALLITVAPEAKSAVLQAYREAAIPAAVIGTLLEDGEGYWMVRGGQQAPLPLFARDELARYFAPGS